MANDMFRRWGSSDGGEQLNIVVSKPTPHCMTLHWLSEAWPVGYQLSLLVHWPVTPQRKVAYFYGEGADNDNNNNNNNNNDNNNDDNDNNTVPY